MSMIYIFKGKKAEVSVLGSHPYFLLGNVNILKNITVVSLLFTMFHAIISVTNLCRLRLINKHFPTGKKVFPYLLKNFSKLKIKK